MACAALKRPHSFDLLTTTSPQQSVASPKRRRCGALAVSTSPCAAPSAFLDATPKLDRDELALSVQEEWRRLQRRRKLMAGPPSPPNSNMEHIQSMFTSTSSSNFSWSSPQPGMQIGDQSPPRCGSMSPPRGMSPPHSGSVSPSRSVKEQPGLTVKQVVILCERLWKEREEKLREEYDQVLNDRLTEQYDAFLKFTQDQIMRKYQQSSCSYVS